MHCLNPPRVTTCPFNTAQERCLQELAVLKEPSGNKEWGFLRCIWILLALLLGFSGLMQLPIAQRYGISALPGLAWTAVPFQVLTVHYILAAFLLFLFLYTAMQQRRKMHSAAPPPRLSGKIRLYLLMLLMLTGFLGVLKNLGSVDFSPLFTEIVVLAHLRQILLDAATGR